MSGFPREHSSTVSAVTKFSVRIRPVGTSSRDHGERRVAHLTQAVADLDAGKTEMALRRLQAEYTIDSDGADTVAVSAHAVAMGDVLLDAGRAEAARGRVSACARPHPGVEPIVGDQGGLQARGQGAGNGVKARVLAAAAATSSTLPTLRSAFVRRKARQIV